MSALARLSSSPVLKLFSWLYVEIIRNTPLLIQIFLIYFVISPVFNIPAFTSAVIALSLFEGAYSSEIIRSGIVNVPRGQYEAAQSIGLSVSATYIKSPLVNSPFSNINRKDLTRYHCQLYSRFRYPALNMRKRKKINSKGLIPFFSLLIDRPMSIKIGTKDSIKRGNPLPLIHYTSF